MLYFLSEVACDKLYKINSSSPGFFFLKVKLSLIQLIDLSKVSLAIA